MVHFSIKFKKISIGNKDFWKSCVQVKGKAEKTEVY